MPIGVALRALCSLGVPVPGVLKERNLIRRGHYAVLKELGAQQRINHTRLTAVELALARRTHMFLLLSNVTNGKGPRSKSSERLRLPRYAAALP